MSGNSLDGVLQSLRIRFSIFPGDKVFPGGVAGDLAGSDARFQLTARPRRILLPEIGDVLFHEPQFTLQKGPQPLPKQLVGWTVQRSGEFFKKFEGCAHDFTITRDMARLQWRLS